MRKLHIVIIVMVVLVVLLVLFFTFGNQIWKAIRPSAKMIHAPEGGRDVKNEMIEKIKTSDSNMILGVYKLNVRQGHVNDIYFALKNNLDITTTFNIKIICHGAEYNLSENMFKNDDFLIRHFNETLRLEGPQGYFASLFDRKKSSKYGGIDVQKYQIEVSPTAELKEWPCELILSYNGTEYAKESFTITVEAGE